MGLETRPLAWECQCSDVMHLARRLVRTVVQYLMYVQLQVLYAQMLRCSPCRFERSEKRLRQGWECAWHRHWHVRLLPGLGRLARLARISSQLLQDQVQGSRLSRREEEWRLRQTQGRGRVHRTACCTAAPPRQTRGGEISSRLVLFCGQTQWSRVSMVSW